MLSWHQRRLWGCGLCVYALVSDQQSRGPERKRFLCTAHKQCDCQCGFYTKPFVVCALWTRPFQYDTHSQEHTHARPQPFPWQEVEATYGPQKPRLCLVAIWIEACIVLLSVAVCLYPGISAHTPDRTGRPSKKREREKHECYKTILFSMDADLINMLLSSISSVWKFCLTAHPTFSQPLKDPRVRFRRTTWRLPFTVRESSSSPAWWALWWCAGWETQPRNLISGASQRSTNWASRSLCGAR